jgi:outer membrane immunogenic protein
MRALVLAALATTMLAAPALAKDTGSYANFGYTHVDDNNVTNGLLGARYGLAVNPNFAVEGEAGVGVIDDTVRGVEVNTDFALGAFALGRLPVSENLRLHARAGYQHQWVTTKAAGIETDDHDGSLAFGVGGQVDISERSGIRADWTRQTNDDIDSFSVAYALKF